MTTKTQMIDLFTKEFKEELLATRTLLERVPEDKLSWKPHQKSMTLGQLALHIAVIPGALAEFISELTREAPTVPLQQAKTTTEILSSLTKSEQTALQLFSTWEDHDLQAEFKMLHDGQVIMTVPRVQMLRSALLNHWYHHRGQLVVYLRLLDIPVPATYGSSADEDPFSQ